MAVGGMGWGKLFRDYTLGADVTGSPTNGSDTLIVSFLIFPMPSLIVNVTTTFSPTFPPFKKKAT